MRRFLSLSAVVLVGCADGVSNSKLDDLSVANAPPDLSKSLSDLSLLSDMPVLSDMAMSTTYPAGPYGNTVGATFPPLVWEGYFDPAGDAIATTKAFAPYSMNDVRLSGRAYAMIHIADYT